MAKGKIAALILERMKPGGGGDEAPADDEEKTEPGPGKGLEAAMQSLGEALAAKDYAAAAEAFRSGHKICGGYEGGGEE